MSYKHSNTGHGTRRPGSMSPLSNTILSSGNTLFYTIPSPTKKKRQHKPCIEPTTGLSVGHLRRTCREQRLDYDEHIRQLGAGQKFCGMCRKYLPADEDHFFRRSKSTLGFSSNCKDCEASVAEVPPTTYDREASEQQVRDLHEWSSSPTRPMHRLRNSIF